MNAIAKHNGRTPLRRNAVAKTHAGAASRPRTSLSNNVLIGYLIAVSMLALLWMSVHGYSSDGAQNPLRNVRDCIGLKDDAARLACYDHVAHAVSPPPGRGFAPR